MRRFAAALAAILLVMSCGGGGGPAPAPPPSSPDGSTAQSVRIAHLADLHLGSRLAPDAAANLRRAVDRLNQLDIQAVIVAGDIGVDVGRWKEARSILSKAKVPVYYVPGNHDTNGSNVDLYRSVFGDDYYTFALGPVRFVVLNSQFLGHVKDPDATAPPPLDPEVEAKADRMYQWLSERSSAGPSAPLIAIQHIPLVASSDFPSSKPYFVVPEPHRSRMLAALRDKGVKQVLYGHWHMRAGFAAEGLTHRVAPATSRPQFGARIGFAVHTISTDATIDTRYEYLD